MVLKCSISTAVFFALFEVAGLAQYSGVDGCTPGPCANATPCRHCSGSWSGNLGDAWNITSSLVNNSVSGTGTIPNATFGCPNFNFRVSSGSISPTGGSYSSVAGTTYLTLHGTPNSGQSCGGNVPTNVTITVQI